MSRGHGKNPWKSLQLKGCGMKTGKHFSKGAPHVGDEF